MIKGKIKQTLHKLGGKFLDLNFLINTNPKEYGGKNDSSYV